MAVERSSEGKLPIIECGQLLGDFLGDDLHKAVEQICLMNGKADEFTKAVSKQATQKVFGVPLNGKEQRFYDEQDEETKGYMERLAGKLQALKHFRESR